MSTIKSYVIGFGASLILTATSFALIFLYTEQGGVTVSKNMLVALCIILALVQLVVQLFFFLHVRSDKKNHWNLVALLLTLFLVAVFVGGSLWIMDNLTHLQLDSMYINGQVSPETQSG